MQRELQKVIVGQDAVIVRRDAYEFHTDMRGRSLQPRIGQRFGQYGPLGGENPVGFTPNGVSDILEPAKPVTANPGTVKKAQENWRKVVSLAAECGVAAPTFSSALSYYDSYRSARLPAGHHRHPGREVCRHRAEPLTGWLGTVPVAHRVRPIRRMRYYL